jgi:hypothetical protein
MFLIGDLGYHFSNFIGDEIDKLCKNFVCNICMLRSQISEWLSVIIYILPCKTHWFVEKAVTVT